MASQLQEFNDEFERQYPPTIEIPGDISVITSNSTGEYLEVFAQKIPVTMLNDLGKAHSTEKTEEGEAIPVSLEALDMYMSPKPIRITLTGFLAHRPAPGKTVQERNQGGEGFKAGVGENTWGSFERPVDLFEIGRRFANTAGTFQFQSPAFPGVVFNDLLIEKFEPVADNKRFNVYNVTIVLQTVLLNDIDSGAQGFNIETIARGDQELVSNDDFLGDLIPEGMFKLPEPAGDLLNNVADIAQDPLAALAGMSPAAIFEQLNQQKPQDAPTPQQEAAAQEQKDFFQQAVDFLSQPDALDRIVNEVDKTAGLIAEAKQAPIKVMRQIDGAMRKVNGWMRLITGSLPTQSFTVDVDGKRVGVFIHWEQGVDRGFVTIKINGDQILTEYPLKLNTDILKKVQWRPEIRGLHITPKLMIKTSEGLTEETIGRQVHLMVETDII